MDHLPIFLDVNGKKSSLMVVVLLLRGVSNGHLMLVRWSMSSPKSSAVSFAS